MEGGDISVSSSIDTRIVEMKFDNTQFETGARQTLGTLEALQKGMKLEGAGKGLQGLNAAGKAVSLSHISSAVDSISQKFSAMSVVAITALSNIANRAVDAGLRMAKSLTIDPIKSGLEEYETNLNSIQTILANTQAAGSTLKDVNGALKELNTYSDQTIYNFSEMARNIGTFTAAGVDLKTSTASIKGIANLAALSGSNSQQASTAMYQLSQAISAGRVSLQDWNSVVNAGMGGTVFQRALAQTAEKMGTLDKGAVKLTGKMKNATINGKSFRESITAKPGEESWLTSEVLTTTLAQFTGDLSDAELAAQGFSKAQIKAIQDQAKMAKSAATEVKTASQLMGTLQEAAGSGWAQSWEYIIGDFEQAKKLWTGVNNVLGGFISDSANARNETLKEWAALGGRTDLLAGIKGIFDGIVSVLKPIRDAFREIFPATTGAQLASMTKTFKEFAQNLKMGGETADRLKRTFAGVFAIFGIGWEIIKQVGRVLFDLFSSAGEGSSSFLEVTASVGDFLTGLHEAIKNGEGLTKLFDKIGAVLKVPIKLVGMLAGALADVFSGLDFGKFDGLDADFKPFEALGQTISKIWSNVMDKLQAASKFFAPLAAEFKRVFGGFGDVVQDGVGKIDFGKVLAAINTGLFAGLLLILKRFIGSADDAVEVVKSWKEHLTGPFDAMTDTLGTMQNTLKAMTLLQIAAAVGILAASAVALSTLDADQLKRALTALTVMLIQITGAMAVFQKIDIKGGMGQLILLALALRILTSAVVKLAELSWEEMAKGLTSTAVLLGLIVAAARLMPDGKKMISSSVGIVILAAGVKILASAVKDLAELSWEELAKGLVGVGVVLGALTLFTKFAGANAGGVLQGAGIILLAVGIKILASAVKEFSTMSWEEIGKGLAAMAGGLVLIAGALMLIPPTAVISAAGVAVVAGALKLIADVMDQMGTLSWEEVAKGMATMAGALVLISAALALLPPTSLLSAAAIFVVASSLGMIATALGTMGGMSWEEIAKGLITLAGALTIIAVAMAGMTTAIFGATALIVVAGALAILAPILVLFGNMSWEEIGKGLVMLAGAFAVIGIAGALLTPVIPTLLGLGIAIGLLGIGIAAAGAGVLAFSLGLTAIAGAGAAATVAIVGIVQGLLGLLPAVVTAIGQAVIAFAQVIATAGPSITMAITVVLLSFMNAIIRLTPKIGQLILALVRMLLNVLQQAIPAMTRAGMNIIVGILNGIAANIGRIVTAATNIIVNFLNGIANNLPRIIQAGVNLIIAFVNGLANGIRNNSKAMGEAGGNLASAMVEGLAKGIAGGLGRVKDAAVALAKSAFNAAKSFLKVNSPSKIFISLGKSVTEGFVKGIDGDKAAMNKAFANLKDGVASAAKSAAKTVADLQAKLKHLQKYHKRDKKAIQATTKALAEARAEQAKILAAQKKVSSYGPLLAQMGALADKQDALNKKIVDAKKALEDAKKARDDFAKSTKDQYDDLPDFSKETKLSDYVTDLQKQIADTQIFTAQLAQLRKMGLNDEMYKELLSKGPDAIPFAQQILEGGQISIDELNSLGRSLNSSASKLGNNATNALYQAGVDAAAGLVKGLEAQEKAIEAQMDKIAASMVASIKKALGIKSPSREFMKVGKWSNEGLAEGLRNSTKVVKAAEGVGSTAIDAMRKTLKGMSDTVVKDVDLNPTIRPVLDLTDIKKNAGKVGGLLTVRPLDVTTAYSKARSAALEYKAVQFEKHGRELEPAHAGDNFHFEQHIHSPKAVSNAEIYRQTNNQISVMKGAVKRK